jgi:glycosyltransferase involved in cell wall biosynthesis
MVHSPALLWVLHKWCRFVYRRASAIIVQSAGFKAKLIERGVPPEKITVVENWAEEAHTHPRGALNLKPYALANGFNVVFAGTLGLAQDLDNLLEAAKLVADRNPRIQILIIGDGVEGKRLRGRVSKEVIGNVRIMPRVGRGAVADILAAADLLLVTLKDDPLFKITIPSKIPFYLAMGKPILVSAKGEAARVVQDSGAGLAVQPGNSSALADMLVDFARMDVANLKKMGSRGADYYRQHLSMSSGIEKVLGQLRRLQPSANVTPPSDA